MTFLDTRADVLKGQCGKSGRILGVAMDTGLAGAGLVPASHRLGPVLWPLAGLCQGTNEPDLARTLVQSLV